MEEAMDFTRIARRTMGIVFAVSVTIISVSNPQSAFATEKADVVAAVHQFFDNLDEKTLPKALATCDSPVSILDEFPPHVWHGPTACADWFKGLVAYNEKSGITDGVATLGAPWTVDVTGDRAYVVAPAAYTFKQHGKPVKEAHAVFTVGLRRTDAGWRITGWTWSKH
jgi:ketosteroid isomerase-like protein